MRFARKTPTRKRQVQSTFLWLASVLHLSIWIVALQQAGMELSGLRVGPWKSQGDEW